MYIYKFTNKKNNKSYIGQTIQDPRTRELEHYYDARKSLPSFYFHNALKKYGKNAFIFKVLQKAKSLEELNNLEEFFIEKFDSINNGYNLRKGGNNKLHNEKSKKLMSESQKKAHARRRAEGKKVSGWKHPTGGPMKGKKFTEAHKEKLRQAHKEKLRQAHLGIYSGMYGKKHTEETKRKMREAWKKRSKRKSISKETREKMRQAALKRWNS